MMLEFAGLFLLLLFLGIGMYVYVDRYGGFGGGERASR
ncbi:putative membrane protein [Halorubrum sp. AJ67]|nr:putative membrane protein [Halorubrum sp. AJ67]